jgi:hypothetical protein
MIMDNERVATVFVAPMGGIADREAETGSLVRDSLSVSSMFRSDDA